MSSSTVNIVRYSFLGFGVAYGFMHQRKLNKEAKNYAASEEYKRKESLIQQAKAEWVKKNLPADQKSAGGDVITDFNDPKFDAEAWLQKIAAEESKSKS